MTTAAGADRLVDLVPTALRMRDAETGGALAALLQVIAEQVEVVDEDIAQLYENWFVETCQPWVVPYIGDLIGYLPAAPIVSPDAGVSDEGVRLLRAAIPRSDVAHTIGDRRRKGTLALLEDVARDASGWPARAVEFYKLLAFLQSIDHLRLDRGRTVDLRDGDALDLLDGPFERSAHTVSVGRIGADEDPTLYNIPNVGLYVWRLRPYSITKAPAYCVDRARNRFEFNALAIDAPLITKPVVEPSPSHVADETNVPAWIRRKALDESTAEYYGPGSSIAVWENSPDTLVPLADVVAADLTDWTYVPREDEVAIDPVLGRIVFAPDRAPEDGVWVTYHYGFSADMGGGEYERRVSPRLGRTVYPVGSPVEGETRFATIMDAVRRWQADRDADPVKRSAIVEIQDSGIYEEQVEIDLEAGDRLELRARNGARPVIRLLDWRANRPDALRIRGVRPAPVGAAGHGGSDSTSDGAPDGDPPQIVFDGLLVTGRSVWVSDRVGCIVIRDCTFVPGWSLEHDCEPRSEEPSLVLERTGARVLVIRSILGSVRVQEDELRADPIRISFADTILDATKQTAWALSNEAGERAHASLTVVRSTVIGGLLVREIELGENSIFLGLVGVARRGAGCIRFSYVPDRSRTPPRHACQPDLVEAAVEQAFRSGTITSGERTRRLAQERLRVRPRFETLRYGKPEYCQLALDCAPEIAQGADDESELGAFHDLFQPQREANLRARLAQFSPAGSEAAVIFAT